MVEQKPFGAIEGEEIPLLCLSDGDIRVELLPFGAAVRSIWVPDRAGKPTDICLGYEDLESYQKLDACLGGTIGRCANRIGGASFVLNGEVCRLTANEGKNTLHGGKTGFHQKLWTYVLREKGVTFTLESPDGEEGFPGNLHTEVAYTLDEGCLTIEYRGRCDRDTVVNLTHHGYFNLGGQGSGPIGDHVLSIRAGRYTPTDSGNVPTGELAPVRNTPLDFQRPGEVGERLSHPFLKATRGFDHNFVLEEGEGPAVTLSCPRTGIRLEMTTTLEGMQLYTAGYLTPRKGKEGAVYGPFHGLCLETQHFPDAANQRNFPTSILRAGERLEERTAFRFFHDAE